MCCGEWNTSIANLDDNIDFLYIISQFPLCLRDMARIPRYRRVLVSHFYSVLVLMCRSSLGGT